MAAKAASAIERYQTFSLFDTRSASELLKGLELAASLSFQDRRKLGVTLEEEGEGKHEEHKSDAVSVTDECRVCCARFETVEEWRAHLKLDWHLYNVKRKAKGLEIVSQENFGVEEGADDEVSSVSGSSSEDSDLEEDSTASPARRKKGADHMKRQLREQPVVFFKNSAGNVLMIHRCLLQASEGAEQSEANVVENAKSLSQRSNIGIILVSGGHFAAAIFEGNQMLVHKTFHSYTVRAKQGGSQSMADSKSGTSAPRSAGASLRRYNAQSFKAHVDKLVSSWGDMWTKCNRIFYRVPARNQGVLFSGSTSSPIQRDDPKLINIPLSVGRPTLNEVKRVHKSLTTVRYYEEFPAFLEELIAESKKEPEKKIDAKSKAKADLNNTAKQFFEKGRGTENGIEKLKELDEQFFDLKLKNEEKEKAESKKGKKKKANDTPTEPKPQIQVDTNPVPKGPAREFMRTLSKAVKSNDLETLRNPGDLPPELLEYLNQDPPSLPIPDETGATLLTRVFNLPVEDGSLNLLHLASQNAKDADGAAVIELLLELGADPSLKDSRGRVPYLTATDKAARNAFRRFMGNFPDKYDWNTARVPSALTEDLEKQQAAKKAERRKALKESKKEKEKAAKAELEARREAEDEQKRYSALSDREKRALAAERRILASQQTKGSAPILVRCHQCGLDISGKVPFVAYDLSFCTVVCLRNYRSQMPQVSF